MRVLAVALGFVALATPAASPGSDGRVSYVPGSNVKIAYIHGKKAVVVYLGSPLRQPIAVSKSGPPHWSGDGRLLSIGGYVVGRARLPAAELVWAPTGETAGYVTKQGGVGVWTPRNGRRVVVPDGWGAQSVAWSDNGSLALGRAVCHGACGLPSHTEIWVWRRDALRRLVGRLADEGRPLPFAWHKGRVLWWNWPNSGSIAADGVGLYANARLLATALMYRDYVDVCGRHLAIAAGGDRYSMHGKQILFDGRDASRDPSRSWVSPSCSAGGALLAAASANTVPKLIGREHRSIWELLPVRRRLTRPPAGWSDESPTLLRDGSLLFVRTRQTSRKVNGDWITTQRGRLELLRAGRLTEVANIGFTANELSSDGLLLNYYGHYGWPSMLAVWPR